MATTYNLSNKEIDEAFILATDVINVLPIHGQKLLGHQKKKKLIWKEKGEPTDHPRNLPTVYIPYLFWKDCCFLHSFPEMETVIFFPIFEANLRESHFFITFPNTELAYVMATVQVLRT